MQFLEKFARHPKPPLAFDYDPPNGALKVLHEDADLIVIDKPAGLLSVRGKQAQHADSVELRAAAQFGEARIVHRLDMDTSGIMVLARNAKAHRHLGLQFEKRQLRKNYIALVEGNVSAQAGTINLPLICDWPMRPKQMVCFENGKSAVTHWRLLKRNNAHSLLKLTPVTGRSHQLRVHLMACGHCIIGDVFYSDQRSGQERRLCLHASTLEFRHPNGGHWVCYNSEHSF